MHKASVRVNINSVFIAAPRVVGSPTYAGAARNAAIMAPAAGGISAAQSPLNSRRQARPAATKRRRPRDHLGPFTATLAIHAEVVSAVTTVVPPSDLIRRIAVTGAIEHSH
jgi:hypothetical protein